MAYTEQLLLPSRGVIYRLPDFDGVVNVKDSFIFYSFLGAIDITNVYPETVIK